MAIVAASGTSAWCQEPAPGSAPTKANNWETWPRKAEPPSDADKDAGKKPGEGAAITGKSGEEGAAGAAAGAKAGQAASAGILSGTTGKLAIIGAVVIGGALALGGGGGTTSNH